MSIRPQKSVETIAALAAFEDTFIKAVSVEYATVAEDGLGGVFAWDETSTATVDNVNVVAHYSGTGRWLRVDQDNFTEVRNNLSDVANADVSFNNLGAPNYLGTKNSGSYWYFDGDDYISVADSSFLSFVNATDNLPFSLSAWIRVDTGATYFPVLAKRSGLTGYPANTNEYYFYMTSGGVLQFGLNYQTSSDIASQIVGLVTDTTALPKGQWVHVAAVFDGSGPNYAVSGNDTADAMHIYVDGIERTTTKVDGLGYPKMYAGDSPVYIGRYNNSILGEGMVREAQITDFALSADEVFRMKSGSVDVITSYAGQTLVNTPSYLVPGRHYKLNSFGVGDDFTSSGAASNDAGTLFVYNGTSPTWSNGSVLITLGAVLDVRAEDTANNEVATRTFYSFAGTLSGASLIGWKSGQVFRSYTGDNDRKILQLQGPNGEAFAVNERGITTSYGLTIPEDGTTTLGVSGGSMTVTRGFQRVNTTAAPSTLDTITAMDDGYRVILMTDSNSNALTIEHNTGNILLQGDQDFVMSRADWVIELFYNASAGKWIELTRRSDEVNIGISE